MRANPILTAIVLAVLTSGADFRTRTESIGSSVNVWIDMRFPDKPAEQGFAEVTLRVWVIDVDGTRLFIEAETFKEARPTVGPEIQKMVDSIQFG